MASHLSAYTTIYFIVTAIPVMLTAADNNSITTASISHKRFHLPLKSFARGMAIAPYIQIPWIVGFAFGKARKKQPLTTMHHIFMEFVEGTSNADLISGISGLLFQQLACTKLVQLYGTQRDNSFLQNSLHAWVLVNCMLAIYKLFRVRYNLEELNNMIEGMRMLNIKYLIAFQKANSKGLHGFLFN